MGSVIIMLLSDETRIICCANYKYDASINEIDLVHHRIQSLEAFQTGIESIDWIYGIIWSINNLSINKSKNFTKIWKNTPKKNITKPKSHETIKIKWIYSILFLSFFPTESHNTKKNKKKKV